MIDTVKLSIVRAHNTFFYDMMLTFVEQRKTGFIMNSTTGIVETKELFRFKVNTYDEHEMMIINGKLTVPSWNYNIFYRMFQDRVDIEFSLPKYIYGTNVLELRQHFNKCIENPYLMLTRSIKKFFNTYFYGITIDYGGVLIQRWDFCYNQVFYSRTDSLKALEYINIKHEKKADTKTYEFGYIELSKSKYLKIYHKGEEFKKHDKQKIVCYHDNFQKMADCILRYERKFTPKNVAYFYNCNVKHKHQPFLIKAYLLAKKKGRISKAMRGDFENVQLFTLGNSKVYNATRLQEDFFNLLYQRFRTEIKQKFSIGSTSVDRLKHEVINTEDKKNRTMKIRILTLIKTFGSLKKAQEKKAISKATYYRYLSFMNEKELSTTNIKSNIYQCWNSSEYFQAISKNMISINFLTNDIKF